MLSREYKKYIYFKVQNTDLFNHSGWVSCNFFCQHWETSMPSHKKKLGSGVQFLYVFRCRAPRRQQRYCTSVKQLHMHYFHISELRIPAGFGTSTLTLHMLPSVSSPRSPWLSKMMSEMSSASNNWTVDSWLPFSSQRNFRGYMHWSNLSYFLTIFLQGRPPSSNGKEHCYCCSRSVEMFIFVCNVYQIYMSLSEAISCKISLLMRLLFISCMLSFLYTTPRKAIDQEQTQQR